MKMLMLAYIFVKLALYKNTLYGSWYKLHDSYYMCLYW